MTEYLISYDLQSTDPDPHSSFRSALEAEGWKPSSFKKRVQKKLPNTTFRGAFEDDDAAVAAYKAALREARAKMKPLKGVINVEKVYICERRRVYFYSNEDA